MIKKMYSMVMVSALLAGVFAGTSWAHQQVAVVPLVTGSKAIGDAEAGDVLEGKTFSGDAGTGVSGTMVNNGAVTINPSASDQAVAAGYHNGSGEVTGDTNLLAENIKNGTTIFGVTGSLSVGSVAVPQTGQTSTVPLNVTGIDGADGILGKGVAWPNPRFTDNGNGTVTDNLTGLVWLQNANCFGQKAWATALTDANTLDSGECGLTDLSVEGDWRLPNMLELLSLVAWQYTNPALSNDAGDDKWISGVDSAFTGVLSNQYWSSTTIASLTGYAWGVNIGDGLSFGNTKTSLLYYVWPVRN